MKSQSIITELLSRNNLCVKDLAPPLGYATFRGAERLLAREGSLSLPNCVACLTLLGYKLVAVPSATPVDEKIAFTVDG